LGITVNADNYTRAHGTGVQLHVQFREKAPSTAEVVV